MTPGGVEAEARAHLAWLRAQGTGLDDAALRVAVVWAFARAVARARGLGPKLARLWRVRAVALGLSPTVWDGADAPTCSAHDPVQLGTAYEVLRAEGRRAAGRYYTPAALAAAVVARACAAVSSRDASQWTVCDPACGGGAFLLAALDVLGEGGARRCWGADIDAGAAETARLSVWLAAGASAGLWPALGRQIVAGDALAEGTLRDGRFDLVVGNPPWLAYAGRAAAPLTGEAREAMRRRYRAMAGFPTLHGAFLQRAMELAAEGGAMGMLVPTPVADLAGYGPTRAAVRCHGRVCKPLDDLSESFPGVGVSCMVAVAVKEARAARDDASPWVLRGREVSAGPGLPSWWRTRREGPPWPAETFRDLGFQSGGRVVAEALHRAEAPAHPRWIALREGRDVTPFVARAPRLWLDPDAPAVAAAGCRVRGPEVFARVDLVLRQTARWPIAARVHDGVGFRNSLLAGFASPAWPALLLVALLNSVVVRAQHRALHRDGRQRTFPQVKVAHLRALATPGCLGEDTAAAMMALAARLETAGEAGDAEAAWALDRLSLAAYGLPDTDAAVEALRAYVAG
jgi:predicted RNA methylase